MKVKVGNKVYDGENEPIMVILSNGEKAQIAQMHQLATRYCIYPLDEEWIADDYKKIKEWMEDI